MPAYPNLSQVHVAGGGVVPAPTPDEDIPMLFNNFTPPLKFQYGKSIYLSTAVTGALNITTDLANAIPGAVAIVRLVANGTNVPTFANTLKASGVPVWTNTAGTAHILQFLYDGVDVWYNILPQPGAVSGGGGGGTVPDPKTTFSNFAINAAGDRLTYNTTLAVSGIVGSINVGGSVRALTHISSGLASFISPTVKVGEPVTVTLTDSLPVSNSAVTAVAVTNGSTVPAGGGLTNRTLTYTLNNATLSNGILTLQNNGAAVVVNEPINTQLPFEVDIKCSGEQVTLLLGDNNSTPMTFGNGGSNINTFFVTDGNILYNPSNNGNGSTAQSGGGELYFRVAKNGNNLDCFILNPDGTVKAAMNTTPTFVNMLAGKTNMYVKVGLRVFTNLTAEVKVRT